MADVDINCTSSSGTWNTLVLSTDKVFLAIKRHENDDSTSPVLFLTWVVKYLINLSSVHTQLQNRALIELQ